MGNESLLGTLSPIDLAQFSQTVQQSDPYAISGSALAQWQPNYSTMNAGQSAATAFARALGAGLLGNYAQNRTAEQLGKVVEILPQLNQNPMGTVAPEGVNSAAYNALRGNAVIRKAQRDAALVDDGNARLGNLLQAIVPDLVRTNRIDPKQALEIAASSSPKDVLQKLDTTQTVNGTMPVSVQDNPLAINGNSTNQKFINLYQTYLNSGMPPVQASAAARQQLEGEVKANSKSFDDAKEARTYGQNLMQLANTARAGMSEAGQTGSQLASLYEKTVSALSPILPFSQEEAKRQAAGDTLLDSIAPEIIKMARPTGGGATSDFEAKAYLGSGPSSSNTPEANAMLVEKLENLGKINIEYADFIEAYRDANLGSTVGADKKWSEYKQNFPIFITKDGKTEINNTRPSWQEYFLSGAQSQQVGSVRPDANIIRQEANALASQGKSDAEIANILRSKYGG
jgi:hypothetical protein